MSAKYKNFDEYIKGEKIVRYTEWFKKCWSFATEAAEENCSSHNKQSTPCCDVCGFPLNDNMECISRIAHINE